MATHRYSFKHTSNQRASKIAEKWKEKSIARTICRNDYGYLLWNEETGEFAWIGQSGSSVALLKKEKQLRGFNYFCRECGVRQIHSNKSGKYKCHYCADAKMEIEKTPKKQGAK